MTLGPDESFNSFLIDPITVPAGVSLIVDGGVTVYGTRNATKYQANLPDVTCGTTGANYPVDGGCTSLITLNAGSGIYGFGVIDGQGGRVFTGLSSNISWWDLTMTKGTLLQASPKVISTPLGGVTPNITLYKITVRNPPFHTIRLEAQGVTIWGVKVQAPWNVYNTDGFDITGKGRHDLRRNCSQWGPTSRDICRTEWHTKRHGRAIQGLQQSGYRNWR